MHHSDNVDKNIKLIDIKPKNTADRMSVEDVLNTTIVDGPSNKQTVDDPGDAKLLRKLDFHLLPAVILFYLLNFLDRVNIGQAKLNGLTTSLHLFSDQYNVCLSAFFVTYVIFEIPSNLALKKFDRVDGYHSLWSYGAL